MPPDAFKECTFAEFTFAEFMAGSLPDASRGDKGNKSVIPLPSLIGLTA
jgi:hypothetical protein